MQTSNLSRLSEFLVFSSNLSIFSRFSAQVENRHPFFVETTDNQMYIFPVDSATDSVAVRFSIRGQAKMRLMETFSTIWNCYRDGR